MKVMLVEDEDELRGFLTRVVGLRHEVRSYALGSDALHALDAEEWAPDALLSDLVLPDIPGEQLARIAMNRHARVILMSGDRSRLAEARGVADTTLVKPFSLRDLFAAMEPRGRG